MAHKSAAQLIHHDGSGQRHLQTGVGLKSVWLRHERIPCARLHEHVCMLRWFGRAKIKPERAERVEIREQTCSHVRKRQARFGSESCAQKLDQRLVVSLLNEIPELWKQIARVDVALTPGEFKVHHSVQG